MDQRDHIVSSYLKTVSRFLISFNVKVAVESAYFAEIPAETNVADIKGVCTKTINAIVTIGGDGTILWANRYFKYGSIPPIIAFAMGTVNYMCNFSVTDYAKVLASGLNLDRKGTGDASYTLEVKSRIECTVFSFP